MADYIDRQATIDKINERQRKLIYCFGFENDAVKIMDIAKSIVVAIPSAQSEIEPADVTEITHGEWMSAPEMWGTFDVRYYCSKCGNHAIINSRERYVLSDYCPHCGAKMDGGKK